jgi:hypothetical protein
MFIFWLVGCLVGWLLFCSTNIYTHTDQRTRIHENAVINYSASCAVTMVTSLQLNRKHEL